MSDTFPFDREPYASLGAAERAQWRELVHAVEWPADEVLLAAGDAPDCAWVIESGHVQELAGGEPVAVHAAGELLALQAVLLGRAVGALVTLDVVRALRVPASLLQGLMAGNARFAARLYAGLAERLDADSDRAPQREFLSLMTAKVREAVLRKPFFVEGTLDLVSVCRELSARGLTNALVRDRPLDGEAGAERIGMFTTTDLRDALVRTPEPAALAVREVARFDLITVDPEADLFEALALMVRHKVHRLLVRDAAVPGAPILGVLSQLDLMSYVSNHSHIVALQIDQAQSVDELSAAAARMDGLVALLHGGGARIEVITGLVSDLNTRLFARLWSLVAPRELIDNSCLVVMGSEGRGEQILKTDQDNALLLRTGFEFDGLDAVAARFNAALAGFGYPPCPGGIMLGNPAWRMNLARWRETLREWVYGHDPDAAMHLAIFLDAQPVAGDAALLDEARAFLFKIALDHDAFLARFTRAIDQFSEASSWWSRFTTRRDDEPIDLKKLGIFPIVHGVRALALQHRVRATGTVARLRALQDSGHIDDTLARDLVEALHFLMALRLTHQLRQRQRGQVAGNLVRPDELGTLERDPLKDSLAIVKRLRAWLAQHFRLDTL